jgi:DNA modification methylase
LQLTNDDWAFARSRAIRRGASNEHQKNHLPPKEGAQDSPAQATGKAETRIQSGIDLPASEGACSVKKEILADGVDLYLGDCREIIPTLGRVDAVVTDPPYEFKASGAGIFRANRHCMDAIQAAGLDKGFDHTLLTAELCNSVVVFCHNDQLDRLIPWLSSQFDRYAVCMWHKENSMPVANKHYRPDTELYVHAWQAAAHPVGDLSEKARWFLAPAGKSEFGHPTVKPLPLMSKIVRNVQAETILDPFCGSGTTGVAAVKNRRGFIGIEINQTYFEIACRRIQAALDAPDMFVEPPKPAKHEALEL